MKVNIVYVVLAGIILLAAYCIWSPSTDGFSVRKNRKSPRASPQVDSSFELVGNSDDDQFQLLGVADEEPAFQIGFGMGPGLYGSGRHTSEMVGN